MKKYIVTVLSIFFLFMLTSCGTRQDEPNLQNQDNKLIVTVSFNAMKEFTEAVGQDKVHIITIIPDGTEPHDFQPTTKNMKELSKTKVFVYQGLGMEPWTDQVIQSVHNEQLVLAEASKGIDSIQNTDPEEIREHGNTDPHAFLSLINAQIEVQNIADSLSKADPENAGFYQQNAASYKAQLQELHDEYAQKFAALPRRDIITGHGAFHYLCREFGLTQHSIEDVFANGEPSTQKLAELAKYCKEHRIQTIFMEDMVSPKTSETLAREVGASARKIYTMESAEGSQTYLDRMRHNLQEIYTSLQ